jgi:hypothetical protein
MSKKNVSARAALGAALLAAAGAASAGSLTVSVDSLINSIGGGVAKSTGVDLSGGEAFTVTVPTSEIWNNSFGDPSYDADADGNTFQTLTVGDFTAAIGSLVGKIGSGDYFKVGTDFSGVANAAGELELFYWDSDSYNNIGAVDATISAVPEPTSLALIGAGLAMFGLSRRRKI